MQQTEFHSGHAFDAYQFFGAHITPDGVTFRTWAPNAKAAEILGEFTNWQTQPMQHDATAAGVFTYHATNATKGQMYKYKIQGENGVWVEHCDPYGFMMERRPGSASIIWPLDGYQFSDAAWLAQGGQRYDAPMNIYEVHLPSWQMDETRPDGWLTYEELADQLIPYLQENGYNFIECMPLSEHPADCSWGYQNTGFYAPTSRLGNPDGLKQFVDRCHAAGIGVLLDYVPVHFAVDGYALGNYDGAPLYESQYPELSHSEWGSFNFDHTKGEVRSFLQSAANYWLKEFHFDGLRMDAVSRLIYWQGEPERGVNSNAVAFLQTMNAGLHALHPNALLIAEDSTNFIKVTAPVEYDGLGFDYKWDLGWMNDTLDYFRKSPDERKEHYHKLSFSMAYFPYENYLMALSHDEVVHGKATIVQKMYGDYEEKFPQARALYLYMYTHPGKKLNFMGNELAHMREWDETRPLDWDITRYPLHDAFHRYCTDLNALYLQEPAFWQGEYDMDNFTWLDCEQNGNCCYAYLRNGGGQTLLAAFNFSDLPEKGYTLTLPSAAAAACLLNTDWTCYGGNTPKPVQNLKKQAATLCIDLAPYSGQLIELT